MEPIKIDEVEEQAKKQKPKKSNLYDICQALLNEMGYQFMFNELSGQEEIRNKDQMHPTPMNDRLFDRIYIEFMKRGVKVSASDLHKIIRGGVSKAYHPIRQYFEGLPLWDGFDYISQLANTITVDSFGMDMDKYWPKYLRKWLVAAAAQATIDDATNHTCLVLMGGQGKGKTTWLNALCPPELQHLRYTGHVRVMDKESLNLLAEKFIVNIDDQLDLIKDLRYLKSMFTLDKVTNRKAFDKYNPNRPSLNLRPTLISLYLLPLMLRISLN